MQWQWMRSFRGLAIPETRETRKMSEKTLIYLAVPYSHPDAEVRLERFHAANKAAAKLMGEGLHIFSPISHTHPIALAGDLPLGWDYWAAYDHAILRACCKLLVLRSDGWEQSRGIAGEIAIAIGLGIPIEFVEPEIPLAVPPETAP